MYRPKTKHGFTLVELLLVIAVISILSLVLITVLNPTEQLKKSNDGRRKSDLAEIQKAVEAYYQDNGMYPSQKPGTHEIDWGSLQNQYIAQMPEDPQEPNSHYVYAVQDDNQSYALYASLERGTKDPQACGNHKKTCHFADFDVDLAACGGSGCNFGIASPNTQP